MEIKPQADRPSSRSSIPGDTGQPDTCGVCLNKYNEGRRIPKSLICGHTICMMCIKGLINHTAKIICPLCRKQTHSRCADIPTNYQLLQILQRMGLLCKIPETPSSSPVLIAEDDLAIEKEHRDNFNALIVHYKSALDEVQASISSLDLDASSITPRRPDSDDHPYLRYLSLKDLIVTAKANLHDLNLVMTEVDKNLAESRRLKCVIQQGIDDNSITVANRTLVFHNNDVEALFQPLPAGVGIHETPQYPLRQRIHTPPPLGSPHVDSFHDYPDFDYFDYDGGYHYDDDDYEVDSDLIDPVDFWTNQDQQFAISRATSSHHSSRRSVGHAPPSNLVWCSICSCQIPNDAASQTIHENGRRHRNLDRRLREAPDSAEAMAAELMGLPRNSGAAERQARWVPSFLREERHTDIDSEENRSHSPLEMMRENTWNHWTVSQPVNSLTTRGRGGRHRRRNNRSNNDNSNNNNARNNAERSSNSGEGSSNNGNNRRRWRGGRGRRRAEAQAFHDEPSGW